MIAKQLAVTINKNNTTAVSAASKPHSRLLKSKTFISKWMFPASLPVMISPECNKGLCTMRSAVSLAAIITGFRIDRSWPASSGFNPAQVPF